MPLTLCGTRRFVRECRASLSTGPTPPRLSVKPTVQLQLEPGRVVMTVEAELSEPSGRFGHVEAKVPAGLRIIQVSAAGLADWSTTADGRLRLMFDGSTASPRRRLRLMGSIPVSEDPLEIGSRQHRIARSVDRMAGHGDARGVSGGLVDFEARRCTGNRANDADFFGILGCGRDDFTAESSDLSRRRSAAARRDFVGADAGDESACSSIVR